MFKKIKLYFCKIMRERHIKQYLQCKRVYEDYLYWREPDDTNDAWVYESDMMHEYERAQHYSKLIKELEG